MTTLVDSIPEHYRKSALWPLVFLAIFVMLILTVVGTPLNTGSAPNGIISYELAGNPDKATAILNSWDGKARERAAFIQGFDFLFIPLYVAAITLACSMTASVLHQRSWPLVTLGVIIAWLVVLAGVLDIIENVSLLVMLFDAPANPWPQIAFWCALPKFVIVILGIMYTLYGAMAYLFKNNPRQT